MRPGIVRATSSVWLIGSLAMLCGGKLHAETPPRTPSDVRPPWQRRLGFFDRMEAAKWEKRIGELTIAEQFADALKAAETLLALREKVQGSDHWEAANARWTVDALRRVLRQGKQGGANFASVASLDRQAEALEKKARYQEAQVLREKIVAIQRAVLGQDHPMLAARYVHLSKTLNAQGKYAEAEASDRKALAIRRKQLGEEHPETALSYNNLANNLNEQGKYKEAEEDLRKALAVWRKVLGEEDLLTMRCWNNLAVNLSSQGKYAEAEAGYRKALAIHRKVLGEWHPLTALNYNNLAENLNAQGKYVEAEANYRKALAIRLQKLGENHRDTATNYNNLALNLSDQGKYAEAEANCLKALAIDRKLLGEGHPYTAIDYESLAHHQTTRGKYKEAEENYRRALAILRKVRGEEHPHTAGAYQNLAASLSDKGKYAEAEALYRRALASLRKVLGEEHPLTANGFASLAHHYSEQGKYAEAEADYRKALAINRKALGEEHPRTANSYNTLASALTAQGKYPEAETFYLQALAIRRKVLGEEHPDTANSFAGLARYQQARGKYAEAEAADRHALAIRRKALGEEHPLTALSYNNVAVALDAQSKYGEAELLHRKALAIRIKVLGEEHPLTGASYHNLGHNQYVQGKYAEAESCWRLAAVHFDKSRTQIAAKGLERATKTSETSPLLYLAGVLARHDNPREAWQRFEESLARGTWDELTARLQRSSAEQAREIEFVSRLARLDLLLEKALAVKKPTREQDEYRKQLLTERRQTQDQLDDFVELLKKSHGPAAGQVFACKDIQAALPKDAALIGWLDLAGEAKAHDPNGEHWAVLLRSTGDPIWVSLPRSGRNNIWTEADTRLPSQLRAALLSPRGDWPPLARRLRRQRLEPLAKYLAGSGGLPPVRHLLVLPSTALAGVPVEVFADDYTISYVLSGTLHAHLLQQPRPATAGLLAVADPIFDQPATAAPRSEEWAPLPGTRLEAELLRRLFPRKEATLLLDAQASEQRLAELAQDGTLAKYRYLHLATHGEFEDRFPLRSALILSQDALPDAAKQLDAGLPVYDGRLTAEKVLRGQWRLGSELVTLSACDTALGKFERGEGFVGFTHALLLAGSRSVCLSLWKVDDAATALLMGRFYQNLLGKRAGLARPMPKAAALAEAKQWLRTLPREEAVHQVAQLSRGVARGKGRPALPPPPDVPRPPTEPSGKADRPYAHPYYWAAFVLLGDPD